MLNLMVLLYNMGAKIKKLLKLLHKRFYDFDKSVVLVGLSNTLLISEAEALGLRTASEVFADRRYEDDGQLVSRQESDATITNTDEALQQVLKWLLKIKLLVKMVKKLIYKPIQYVSMVMVLMHLIL